MLYYGLAGASAVAFPGATDFAPELNYWLQIAACMLPLKGMDGIIALSNDKIVHLACEQVESSLRFAGFLVFPCPLRGHCGDVNYQVTITLLSSAPRQIFCHMHCHAF